MLLSSFLLCCFLPTLLPWFLTGDGGLRGIRLMWPLLLAGAGLYLWALHAGRCRRGLLLGGLALLAAHLALFVTTETAIRRLLEKRRPRPQP